MRTWKPDLFEENNSATNLPKIYFENMLLIPNQHRSQKILFRPRRAHITNATINECYSDFGFCLQKHRKIIAAVAII